MVKVWNHSGGFAANDHSNGSLTVNARTLIMDGSSLGSPREQAKPAAAHPPAMPPHKVPAAVVSPPKEIPGWALVVRYLSQRGGSQREEVLYSEVCQLTFALQKQGYFVDLDFKTVADKVIYSSKLEEALRTCQSAGAIREKHGSIIYELTELGQEAVKRRESPVNDLVPKVAFEAIDAACAALPKPATK